MLSIYHPRISQMTCIGTRCMCAAHGDERKKERRAPEQPPCKKNSCCNSRFCPPCCGMPCSATLPPFPALFCACFVGKNVGLTYELALARERLYDYWGWGGWVALPEKRRPHLPAFEPWCGCHCGPSLLAALSVLCVCAMQGQYVRFAKAASPTKPLLPSPMTLAPQPAAATPPHSVSSTHPTLYPQTRSITAQPAWPHPAARSPLAAGLAQVGGVGVREGKEGR